MKFSLKLKEVPVCIEDLDGKERTFTMRELTGAQRDAFLDSMAKRMKYVGTQVQGLSKYEGLQAELLSYCLYDDNNEAVKAVELQKYPAGVLTALFDEAQKLSGLTITPEDLNEAKNA